MGSCYGPGVFFSLDYLSVSSIQAREGGGRGGLGEQRHLLLQHVRDWMDDDDDDSDGPGNGRQEIGGGSDISDLVMK